MQERKREILLQNTFVRAQALEIKKSQFYFLIDYSMERLKEQKIGMSKETRQNTYPLRVKDNYRSPYSPCSQKLFH